ncbi:hypothetical protein QOT17_023564 [Balamuthia mandrillaris]
MAWVVERYLAATLVVQFCLSMVNSLFQLVDFNALLSLFGFYGLHQHAKYSLLLYILFCMLSICMDVTRLAIWGDYIVQNLLGRLSLLGTYYIVLTSFGAVVKLVGCIFAYIIYRDIAMVEKEPLLATGVITNNTRR